MASFVCGSKASRMPFWILCLSTKRKTFGISSTIFKSSAVVIVWLVKSTVTDVTVFSARYALLTHVTTLAGVPSICPDCCVKVKVAAARELVSFVSFDFGLLVLLVLSKNTFTGFSATNGPTKNNRPEKPGALTLHISPPSSSSLHCPSKFDDTRVAGSGPPASAACIARLDETNAIAVSTSHALPPSPPFAVSFPEGSGRVTDVAISSTTAFAKSIAGGGSVTTAWVREAPGVRLGVRTNPPRRLLPLAARRVFAAPRALQTDEPPEAHAAVAAAMSRRV
eukprot:CAMPEP_0197126658 /NCGR_PEP_ID=MMETSP1390-20130617/10901_1 /TAXON_ID=38833 /ORGANISM="Micromonas sp., Strain CCMP2099" /LENGTH=280 /DNA_ID=CAMNT_0042568897 /DNA_START=162 /DNA_END=1004 /DNA_ORIENTATION=-